MKFNKKSAYVFGALAILMMSLCSCKDIDETVPVDLSMDVINIVTVQPPDLITDDDTQKEDLTKITDVENNSETQALTVSIDEESDIVQAITLSTYEVSIGVGQSKMPMVTMLPANAADKSEFWVSSDENVATVDSKGNITAVGVGECIVKVTSGANMEVFADVKVYVTSQDVQTSGNADNNSDAEITYIQGILVVNKTYALPSDYAPGVSEKAANAYDKMQDAANAEGLNIYIASGYRSYDYQDGLYNRYVQNSGKEQADRFSARAGHSEHQTGLAFDLNSIDDSFKDTAEGKWVAAHCHEYGFIIRYPEGKESITGYMYEPWHIRYLGVDTATAVYESGLTLEEYLGITSAYND